MDSVFVGGGKSDFPLGILFLKVAIDRPYRLPVSKKISNGKSDFAICGGVG